MRTIYIPGQGRVDLDVVAADRAAREYDERLSFRRNEETGDYCIFIKMPHGQPDYPVLGFGQKVPDRDEIWKRLYETDGVRFGEEIMERTLRFMKAEKAAKEKYMRECAEQVAEVDESAMHRQGNMVKYHRSLSKGKQSKRTGGKD